jgi:hypothetical protein
MDADRERDELLQSIQRLEADKTQTRAKIRQLSDINESVQRRVVVSCWIFRTQVFGSWPDSGH